METEFQITVKKLLWGGTGGGSQILGKFCNKSQVVWMSKTYDKLKKTRQLKLRNLAVFHVREDARVWAQKSFLCYTPQRSGASIWCFHILSFPSAHCGERLQSDGYWMAGILSFRSSLGVHWITIPGGCNCWWLSLPLFIDKAGRFPLLNSSIFFLMQHFL